MKYKLSPHTYTATQVTPEVFIFYKNPKTTKKDIPQMQYKLGLWKEQQHSLGQKREQVVETRHLMWPGQVQRTSSK